MKRTLLVGMLLIALFTLSACSARASASTRSGGTGGSRIITPGTKLAVGIIKLEGTPQAVDSATAAKLLPLWQLLLQLDSSTSAAPQEVTAVVDQIRNTLAPAQVSAINTMTITQADLFSGFQSQGAAGGTATAGGGGGSRAAGGGFPGGGGFGGGGGGIPGGGGFGGGGTRPADAAGSSTTSSSTAQRSQNTAAVPGFLVNEVITLLKGKITG